MQTTFWDWLVGAALVGASMLFNALPALSEWWRARKEDHSCDDSSDC